MRARSCASARAASRGGGGRIHTRHRDHTATGTNARALAKARQLAERLSVLVRAPSPCCPGACVDLPPTVPADGPSRLHTCSTGNTLWRARGRQPLPNGVADIPSGAPLRPTSRDSPLGLNLLRAPQIDGHAVTSCVRASSRSQKEVRPGHTITMGARGVCRIIGTCVPGPLLHMRCSGVVQSADLGRKSARHRRRRNSLCHARGADGGRRPHPEPHQALDHVARSAARLAAHRPQPALRCARCQARCSGQTRVCSVSHGAAAQHS